MCMPYGFTVSQCVNGDLLMIIPGLGGAVVVGRTADNFRCHLIIIKCLAVVTGASMLAFSVGFFYGVCTAMGIGIVSPVAVSVEFITGILYPISPELALGILWGVLTIGCGYMADQNGGLLPGVYLLVAPAMACRPSTLTLGLWGKTFFRKLGRAETETILRRADHSK